MDDFNFDFDSIELPKFDEAELKELSQELDGLMESIDIPTIKEIDKELEGLELDMAEFNFDDIGEFNLTM